jgi:quinolinate synthase
MAFKLRTSSSSPLQQVGEKGKKNISYKDYRESGNMPASEAKFYQGSGTKRVSADFKNKPKKVMLVTECSMSDNVEADNPEVEFVKPCNLCPYMKKINLEKILDCLKNETNEIIIDKKISDAARKSVLRMTEIGR